MHERSEDTASNFWDNHPDGIGEVPGLLPGEIPERTNAKTPQELLDQANAGEIEGVNKHLSEGRAVGVKFIGPKQALIYVSEHRRLIFGLGSAAAAATGIFIIGTAGLKRRRKK